MGSRKGLGVGREAKDTAGQHSQALDLARVSEHSAILPGGYKGLLVKAETGLLFYARYLCAYLYS